MSGIIINPYNFGAAVDEAYSFKYDIDAGDLDVELYSYAGITGFNYDVDWGDGTSDTGVVINNHTHTYPSAGEYIVRITGIFPGLSMSFATTARRNQIKAFLNWGTVPLKSIYGMFEKCINMTYEATDAPDLSGVIAPYNFANYMFMDCTSITSLDLSNWTDTDNIMQFYQTFYNTTACTLLNLTNWDTSNATTSHQAFGYVGSAGSGCEFILPSLDWAGQIPYQGFIGAKFSASPDVSNWVMPSLPNLTYLFYNTDGAVALDLSTWDISNVTSLLYTFGYCEFTSLNLTNWDTSNVTTFAQTFYNSQGLTHITGLSGFNASSCNSIRSMFYFCKTLSFGLSGSTTNFGSNWGPNLGGVTTFQYTFGAVGNTVPGLPPTVSNWDVSGGTGFYQMFISSRFTAGMDFSNWVLSALHPTAKLLRYMFYASDGITTIDFTNAALPGTESDLTYMFGGSEVESVTWGATCDFSGITTMLSNGYLANISNYEFNVTADFTSLAIATNFLSGTQAMGGAGSVANYDNFLTRMDATWVDPGGFSGTLTMGASRYTGGGAVATAKANLAAAGWTITDGGTI